MNYTTLLVDFKNYRRKAPIGKNAILLYFILWEYINEYRLPTEGFTAANSVLQANSGLSRRDLDDARNELKLKGYIRYAKGSGNQCGTYLIVRFDTQNDTQIDTQNDTQDDTQSDTQNDTQTHHISNTKLNKTKQNKKESKKVSYPPIAFEKILEDESEALKIAILEFAEHKKAIKKPFASEMQFRTWLKRLKSMGDAQMQIAVIEQSIAEGWQGIFPLKTASAYTGGKGLQAGIDGTPHPDGGIWLNGKQAVGV